jgi:hypothetical protein
MQVLCFVTYESRLGCEYVQLLIESRLHKTLLYPNQTVLTIKSFQQLDSFFFPYGISYSSNIRV